jgi:amidase
MGRSVEDVAILLAAMAGADPADPATAQADDHAVGYAAALDGASLNGRRLGVLAFATGLSATVDAVFDQALESMRAGGAEVILLSDYKRPPEISAKARFALMREFKTDLNAYLATTPAGVKARSLSDLIAFNRASDRELALFGQEYFELAEATKGTADAAYAEARATAVRLAGAEGIDRLIADYRLDALIAPTAGPASRIDFATGDHTNGRSSGLPAICGYPHLTVPMGQVQGLPVGLSFIGPAWSEPQLLALGYAFEQAAQARKPPTYIPSLEATAEAALAGAPSR